ncbi:MAG: hypothetical protein IJG00_00805 [Clostridia bacterium]|nr:hypothetical protein [Clostridia bacterium]
MKKIVSKALAITLSAISLLNISPINALDDKKLDEPQITQQIQEQDVTTTEEKSDLLKYLKEGLIGAGVGVGVYVSFKLLRIGICTERLDYLIEQTRKEYLEKFKGHIGPNILTKRQEGIGWCWLACFQGLLKDRGIEKSQKELFKGITGKSPGWFEVTRSNAMELPKEEGFFEMLLDLINTKRQKLVSQLGLIDYYSIKEYINKEFKLNLSYEKIHVTEDNTDDICDCINNVYQKNKKPFAIWDSMVANYSGGVVNLHMVNVVEIKNNYITVECPTTELRRTENIHDFVKRYNENKVFRVMGVFLYWIS